MSGWKEIEYGTIKIVHHSTSSVIEIIVKENTPDKEQNEIWINYTQLYDLIIAIEKLKHMP